MTDKPLETHEEFENNYFETHIDNDDKVLLHDFLFDVLSCRDAQYKARLLQLKEKYCSCGHKDFCNVCRMSNVLLSELEGK